jgi:TonB family protein
MTKWAPGILLLAVWSAPAAFARSDKIADELKKDYQTHVVGVRYPIHEGDQKFDAAGQPIETGDAPAWELYGGVLVQKLSLSHDALRIEGPRVAFGDSGKNKPQIRISKRVRFEIPLDHPAASVEEGKAILDRVFYLDEKDVDHLKPEYRRHGSSPLPDVVLADMKDKSEYVVPHPEYTPEPEFSDEARRKKSQGTVILSILVDKSGNVSSVRIERAIGYGLDQNAVKTVRTWRFKPGSHNGQPVSMRFNIEVDFHLY